MPKRYLCTCNKCGQILIDENHCKGSILYEGSEESFNNIHSLEQIQDEEEGWFWGCLECSSDSDLMDNISDQVAKERGFKAVFSKYFVTVNYGTINGNPATKTAVIEASTPNEANDILANRVRDYKCFMKIHGGSAVKIEG